MNYFYNWCLPTYTSIQDDTGWVQKSIDYKTPVHLNISSLYAYIIYKEFLPHYAIGIFWEPQLPNDEKIKR